MLDLIRKLALLKDQDCEPDPAAWYRTTFGKDADYAELLDAIGKTPTERQQLLRSYFEPTDEEREKGFKQPTRAHRAIASLVADGFCRVILTTNFDKLTERAVEDAGVVPTIISTPDAIEGALPLVHQKCRIIKLHGDYLDIRIKNTPAELAQYDDLLNRLLDQVFDQFGLIVCGWSGQWDVALRRAIERCPSRRFSMYWAGHDDLSAETQQLVRLRQAQVVRISDADSFFGRLTDLVTALKESHNPHPVSLDAAVALVKRYLSDPRHRIALDDMLAAETESVHQRIEDYSEEILKLLPLSKPFDEVSDTYRGFLVTLQAMLIHGVAQGTSECDKELVCNNRAYCLLH